MNKNDIKLVAYATSMVVVTVVSLKRTARIIREENAKRVEIKKNADLDILAIQHAGEIITKRIHEGKYDGNFNQLLTDFNETVAFEKIAIREQ